MSDSWSVKHRGPDLGGGDHRKDKIRLATPRRSKHVKVTSEEVSEAVELFLRKGGVIQDMNEEINLKVRDANPARDRNSSNSDLFVG